MALSPPPASSGHDWRSGWSPGSELPSPARSFSGRAVLAGAGAVLVLACVAGALGWLARDAVTGEPAGAPVVVREVAAGPVALVVPVEWARLPRVPGIEGLDRSATAVLAPTPGLRAYTVATMAPIDHPSLIPASVRALLAEPLPAPRRSELAGLPAWRYPAQGIRDARRMEVTVVPSTAGVLAVACIAGEETWVAALGCASGVRRLSLTGGAWLRPAPAVAVQARLPSVLTRLDERRVALRRELRRARTRGGQARLAARLARAYSKALASLSPAGAGSGSPAAIAAALRRSAGAHRRLSGAARAGSPRRYRSARRAVERSERGLAAAVAKLG